MLGEDKSGLRLKPAQTALLAYVCGFFWYMGNCYWIYQTMHLYGEIPKIASLGILVLFSLYVALYHALFGALIGVLRRKFSVQAILWTVPFLWVAVELARARITGFPWDLLGCTQVDSLAVTRLAPLTGVMGLSFVVALVNILWISKLPWRGISGALVGGILVGALLLLGWRRSYVTAAPTSATAVLLQENLNIGADVGPGESTEGLLSDFTKLSLNPTFAPGISSSDGGSSQIIAWPEAHSLLARRRR